MHRRAFPPPSAHPAGRFAIAYEALVAVVAVICVIGLPMGGLVLRFALRPLVQDLTTAMKGDVREELAEVRERMTTLEKRLDAQDETLERLVEAEQFRHELDAGDGGA